MTCTTDIKSIFLGLEPSQSPLGAELTLLSIWLLSIITWMRGNDFDFDLDFDDVRFTDGLWCIGLYT